MGGSLLLTRFPRLIVLDTRNEAQVSDKIIWEGDSFSWEWTWRHERRGRESGELADFIHLFQRIRPAPLTDDCWIWSWAADGVYSVKVVSFALDVPFRIPVSLKLFGIL